jgi:hypothetical protein
MRVRQGTGSRKFVVTMVGLGMGFALALLAFVLAAQSHLAPEFVKVIEAFAGMVAVALGSFAAGNAVEHYARKDKPDGQ